MEAKAKLLHAAGEIGKILAQLEQDLGEKVDSIEISSCETTNMQDKYRREMARVVIHMEAPTRRDWASS